MQLGAQNKDFGTVSQTDLTGGLVSSVTNARVDYNTCNTCQCTLNYKCRSLLGKPVAEGNL